MGLHGLAGAGGDALCQCELRVRLCVCLCLLPCPKFAHTYLFECVSGWTHA